MAQSIFIFDFGSDEDAAQQARHKVDSWKQGFRLGNKMLLKFDRQDSAGENAEDGESPKKEFAARKPKTKKAANSEGSEDESAHIQMLVRLDFSDHEKLSHQRWLDRIPNEEPFKSAHPQVIRTGDPEFPAMLERFEDLD